MKDLAGSKSCSESRTVGKKMRVIRNCDVIRARFCDLGDFLYQSIELNFFLLPKFGAQKNVSGSWAAGWTPLIQTKIKQQMKIETFNLNLVTQKSNSIDRKKIFKVAKSRSNDITISYLPHLF
jgi:hypothetical protein